MNLTDNTNMQPIEIQMFGGFRITVGEKTISDTDTRTRQLWHLLQYLVAFRDKTISQEEIIKIMWPENDIENPANALKNLVYRIRTTFVQWEIPYAREMIVYNRGSYQWNNKLPCIIDVEQFEQHCKDAKDSTKGEDYQIEEYLKAIELYRGDFLPSSSGESWVIPISSYLRTLFFKSVYAKLDIHRGRGTPDDFEMIVLTCRRTLIIDPLEEAVHRRLIFALYQLGRQREALEHYNFVTEQFYRELGLGPSTAMQDLFLKIAKTTNVDSNITALQADLRETEETEGAFYCAYEVFKNLYRLAARTAARTGQAMFICMLTTENMNGTPLSLPLQTRVMDVLKDSVQNSLRKGDVFSRFSSRQYALMLPTGSYENSEMVVARILRNYRKNYRNVDVSVHAKIVPLEPNTH